MLYENISYPDQLPFKIFFSNIVEENYHYHKELEMSFVLRGTTHYKIHHLDYSLKQGSIIIVDSSDLHRIFHSSDDILMLTIQVDLDYFSDQYPAIASSIFVCEIPDGKDPQEYQELQNKNKILKRLLTKIMIAYQQKGGESLLLSYVENLISTLVEQFQDQAFHGQEESLVIETREGRTYVPLAQIYYFEAREKRVYVRLKKQEMAFYETMEHLEERLPDYFVRCHRSFIVSRQRIRKVMLSKSLIELEQGMQIPLSRSYKPAFKEQE